MNSFRRLLCQSICLVSGFMAACVMNPDHVHHTVKLTPKQEEMYRQRALRGGLRDGKYVEASRDRRGFLYVTVRDSETVNGLKHEFKEAVITKPYSKGFFRSLSPMKVVGIDEKSETVFHIHGKEFRVRHHDGIDASTVVQIVRALSSRSFYFDGSVETSDRQILRKTLDTMNGQINLITKEAEGFVIMFDNFVGPTLVRKNGRWTVTSVGMFTN